MAQSTKSIFNHEYIDLRQAAALGACSISTVKRRIRSGELPAYHNGSGRKLFVRPADVLALFRPASPSHNDAASEGVAE